ncbi:urease accessory protein UreD [Massilia aquatica]|uniref:Urease accessory protein UreD n=1 Tax=Massilia aquatica TaxID=2609000 RepID=A0ABX0M9L4_9BURK|nr:urease accessory protein UreD [Massilia aquatica]NHZ43859.1 urease accessory protein UreD [Massilia aquatica]
MRDCHPTEPTHSAWQATLRLRFADDGGTTRLLERAHSGPLRVQKPLYPEGARICHAIIVHPPGGVVGGDRLSVSVSAGASAHAFLTSPGAAKWYRANGKISRQDVMIDAGAGAAVEWMPQEAIFFNGAHVALEQRVELAVDASYIGCDILCLGRRASGETFDSGTITQHTQIRRGGKLLWWEQGALVGSSAAMHSPLGLSGASVCATLVGVGKPAGAALIDAVRALDPHLGITQLKSVFVARYLGDDSESARRVMFGVWQLLRPHLLGCAAPLPRIWNT